MDKHEAQRRKAEGAALLEQLGEVPVAYGLGCTLPAAHDEPLEELERIWYDLFETGDREWLVILNGESEGREIGSIGMTLEAGAAFVVCDGTKLAHLTPLHVSWFFDPDSGDRLEGDVDVDEDEADGEAIREWEDTLLEALHTRLTEKGKELPPLSEIVREDN